jgi:recombination protein RecA
MAKEKDVAVPAAKESKEDKMKQMKAFMDQVAKKHGDSELMILGNQKRDTKVEVVSTGSITLDMALGCGGFPRGRVVEIFGQEASGKTTTTLSLIAEGQKQGLYCGFIDAEQALDVGYAKKLGVKFDETFTHVQPNSGEQALQLCVEMVNSGLYGVIVIDSVAALTPQKEIEGEIEDNNMGLQARMMSKALRVLTPAVAKNNVLVVFINQLRDKIGVMFGSPETTTGGNALKFYASVRLRVTKQSGKDKQLEVKIPPKKEGDKEETATGYLMKITIQKNKMAAPHEFIEVPILYGHGVYSPIDIFTAAVAANIIEVEGRTHTFKGEVLGKSAGDALSTVQTNVKMCKEIEKALRASLA